MLNLVLLGVRDNALASTHKAYPEWPHRQHVGLAYPWTCVRAPVAAASLEICRPRLHRAIRGAQGVLPRPSTAPGL